jgi:hypothetical protein
VQCFSKGTFQTVDVRKVDDIRADAPQELYTLVYPNLLINRWVFIPMKLAFPSILGRVLS